MLVCNRLPGEQSISHEEHSPAPRASGEVRDCRRVLYPCEFSVLVSTKIDMGQTEREVVSVWTPSSPVCFLAISNLRQDLFLEC